MCVRAKAIHSATPNRGTPAERKAHRMPPRGCQGKYLISLPPRQQKPAEKATGRKEQANLHRQEINNISPMIFPLHHGIKCKNCTFHIIAPQSRAITGNAPEKAWTHFGHILLCVFTGILGIFWQIWSKRKAAYILM
jgi:hypothetical protein